jgi:hypothetical protein
MEKRDVVRLTDEPRAALEKRCTGPLTLRQRHRVQGLLRADRDATDEEIAAELGATPAARRRCWPTAWSSGKSSSRCRTTPSCAGSQTRAQAVAEVVVVPAQGWRRPVRLEEGGRAGAK